MLLKVKVMNNRRNRQHRKQAAVILTPEEVIKKRRRQLAAQADIISFFSRLVFMAILLWVLFGMIFGITAMKNDDMSPRISAGDLMLYYRLEDSWHADDVVVFEKDGTQYTGRIVAQGGDTVEITEDARLKINGSSVTETNIYYETPRYEDYIDYPVTLEKNEVFILCDYRQGAKDSRYFGPVTLDELKGKVITVIRRSDL